MDEDINVKMFGFVANRNEFIKGGISLL